MTAPAGSEEVITSEDEWISKFSKWDLDDDVPGTSASAPPPATEETATVEESEAEESGDDNDEYEPTE